MNGGLSEFQSATLKVCRIQGLFVIEDLAYFIALLTEVVSDVTASWQWGGSRASCLLSISEIGSLPLFVWS